MKNQAVDQFANFVLGTDFNSLPAETITAAKMFFLDTLAVGIAGSRVDSAAKVLKTAQLWGQGENCTVLGTGVSLPANSAAFVNSFQIHCQEYDCLHEPATVHAMAVLSGALMAAAEEGEYSGKDLILAVTLGVDVATNLGLAATQGLRFFRPATAGALGATAALARTEGFNQEQFKNAWGLTYSQLSGTMQAHVEGSMALPLQIAVAARSVITSIQMVKNGLTGPHDILEGPFGYFELFEQQAELGPVLESLGQQWRVCELSHKPFPTGRAAHGTLEALQIIQRQHALKLEEIVQINAHVPSLVKRLVDRPSMADMTVNYARLCLPYLVPVLLKTGSVDTQSFNRQLRSDPEILAAGNKVQIIDDGNPNPNALGPQKTEIVFKNGDRLVQEIPHTLGSPGNPLSQHQRRQKFFHCLDVVDMTEQQGKRLLQLLETLEDQAGVADILGLSVTH
jgi:aconitate decarboxylase